jgi:hypothetical protein
MMSLQFTYDVMPHLTDIISNIMGYIMVYILIQAEPWLVLPSVSIAKSVLKTFKNPLQAVSRVAGTISSKSGGTVAATAD